MNMRRRQAHDANSFGLISGGIFFAAWILLIVKFAIA